jgi:hypothetical protein
MMTFKLSGGKLVLTNDGGMLQKKDCDGKDYPISANLKDYTWSCRFTDPYTEEMVSKEKGKIISLGTDKISADGKTLVMTRKNPDGKVISESKYERIEN